MFLKYYLMQKHINHFMSEYNFFYKKKIFRITLKERFLKEKKGLEEIRIHCYKKQQQIKSLLWATHAAHMWAGISHSTYQSTDLDQGDSVT